MLRIKGENDVFLLISKFIGGKMAIDKIIISGMVFYGYHGVDKAEQELGQRFLIDIELGIDLRIAGKSDQIEDTVDYKSIYDLVKRIEQGKKYQLLEALASDIAEVILDNPRIEDVLVRIKKPQVPISGIVDYAAVEIIRGRK